MSFLVGPTGDFLQVFFLEQEAELHKRIENMSPQSISTYIASLGLSVMLSVLVGINVSRLRGLTHTNFLERANDTAATTITAEIADLLESRLVANHVENFPFSPDCRSAVALVEKLVGGSQDLALLNGIHTIPR